MHAKPAYPHQPRLLTPAENEAITIQCILSVYPDDKTRIDGPFQPQTAEDKG